MCSNLVRKFIQTGTLNFNIACRSLMCTVSADGDGHGSIQWFDASFKWIKKSTASTYTDLPNSDYAVAVICDSLLQNRLIACFIPWFLLFCHFIEFVIFSPIFIFISLFRVAQSKDRLPDDQICTYTWACALRRAHSMISNDIRQPERNNQNLFSFQLIYFYLSIESDLCFADLIYFILKNELIIWGVARRVLSRC